MARPWGMATCGWRTSKFAKLRTPDRACRHTRPVLGPHPFAIDPTPEVRCPRTRDSSGAPSTSKRRTRGRSRTPAPAPPSADPGPSVVVSSIGWPRGLDREARHPFPLARIPARPARPPALPKAAPVVPDSAPASAAGRPTSIACRPYPQLPQPIPASRKAAPIEGPAAPRPEERSPTQRAPTGRGRRFLQSCAYVGASAGANAFVPASAATTGLGGWGRSGRHPRYASLPALREASGNLRRLSLRQKRIGRYQLEPRVLEGMVKD